MYMHDGTEESTNAWPWLDDKGIDMDLKPSSSSRSTIVQGNQGRNLGSRQVHPAPSDIPSIVRDDEAVVDLTVADEPSSGGLFPDFDFTLPSDLSVDGSDLGSHPGNSYDVESRHKRVKVGSGKYYIFRPGL